MLADGLRLLDGSEISRTLVENDLRGTSFPLAPSEDDTFELTATFGQFSAGIYVFTDGDWIIKYPGNSLLPYDISGSTLGTIANGATIARFVASRGFTLREGFEYCVALCQIAPSTEVTFSITRQTNAGFSIIGSIYFAASETVGIYSQLGSGDIKILAGDVISVAAPNPVDQFLSDVMFTLSGSLN
jgi:hypothetical protein